MCKPVEALETATANLAPTNFAILFSNLLVSLV